MDPRGLGLSRGSPGRPERREVMQRHRKEYALGRVVTVRPPVRLGAVAPSVAASRWAVALGVLVVWVLLGALPAARADNVCKPAEPLPQSKCTKDAQCCAGLFCAPSGGDMRCQPGCRIGGQFYASGASNPTNACQSCQPSVSTTVFA